MNGDKETAAGVAQTPVAAETNHESESTDSVALRARRANGELFSCPHERSLALAAAWGALQDRFPPSRKLRRGTFVMPTTGHTGVYELMGDLSLRLIDPCTGAELARTTGLLGRR